MEERNRGEVTHFSSELRQGQGTSKQAELEISLMSRSSAKKLKLSAGATGTKSRPTQNMATTVSWQTSLTNSKERWRYLLDNHNFSDVTFLVGEEGERIPAHRLVLSLNSPVFEVMFNERWKSDCQNCLKKEAQKSGTVKNLNNNEIELPDLDPTAFRYFLRYIYTDEFEVPLDSIIDLVHVSEFLDLPLLAEKCKDILFANVNTSNALRIYEKTQRSPIYRDSDIERMCLEYIMFDAKTILQTDGILELSPHSWSNLLKYDRLRIDEPALFSALWRWAESVCGAQDLEPTGKNIRNTLGDSILGLIRFPLMSPIEFTIEVAERKGLLTSDEVICVFKRISCIQSRNEDLKLRSHQLPVSRFSEVPRNQTHIIHILKSNSTQVVKTKLGEGSAESIRFTISRDITLIGCGVYGIRMAPDNVFDIEITLWDRWPVLGVPTEGFVPKMLETARKLVQSADSMDQIIPVLFPSPVKLRKGKYELKYVARGPETFYNAYGGSLSKSVNITLGNKDEISFMFFGNDLISKYHMPQIYFVL